MVDGGLLERLGPLEELILGGFPFVFLDVEIDELLQDFLRFAADRVAVGVILGSFTLLRLLRAVVDVPVMALRMSTMTTPAATASMGILSSKVLQRAGKRIGASFREGDRDFGEEDSLLDARGEQRVNLGLRHGNHGHHGRHVVCVGWCAGAIRVLMHV